MKAFKKLVLSVLFATLATSSFGGEPLRYFGQNETAYHSHTIAKCLMGTMKKSVVMQRQVMGRKFILNAMAKAHQ